MDDDLFEFLKTLSGQEESKSLPTNIIIIRPAKTSDFPVCVKIPRENSDTKNATAGA